MLPMFFSPVTPFSGFDFLASFFISILLLLLVFSLLCCCCCCCCCLPELLRLRTLGSVFDVFVVAVDCCLVSLVVDEERDGRPLVLASLAVSDAVEDGVDGADEPYRTRGEVTRDEERDETRIRLLGA